MKRRQSGQSLVELALAAPLFLAFFWFTWQWILLVQSQLQLSSLGREYVLSQSRLCPGCGLSADVALLRRLAVSVTDLEPARLDLEVGPAPVGSGLGWVDWGFWSFLFSGIIQGLVGQKVVLHYRFKFRGLAATVFPGGLDLKESLVVKTESRSPL